MTSIKDKVQSHTYLIPHLHLIKDVLKVGGGARLEQDIAKAEVNVVAPDRTHPKVDSGTCNPAPDPIFDSK